MADVEHYHRGNAQRALISFEQCKLLLRPMLKGSLEQSAAFMFVFYDSNFDGLLTAAEVRTLIEGMPLGSHSERDLLDLLSAHRKGSYCFDDYVAHTQARGLHGGIALARELLLAPNEHELHERRSHRVAEDGTL